MVERSTRYCQLVALPEGQGAEAVRDALIKSIGPLPKQLRRSLTWDQGREMKEHLNFTVRAAFRSTSAIPEAPGSGAQTKTQTGSSASTSPSARTSVRSPKPSSTASRRNLTVDRDRRWGGSPRPSASRRSWPRRLPRPHSHPETPKQGRTIVATPRPTASAPRRWLLRAEKLGYPGRCNHPLRSITHTIARKNRACFPVDAPSGPPAPLGAQYKTTDLPTRPSAHAPGRIRTCDHRIRSSANAGLLAIPASC